MTAGDSADRAACRIHGPRQWRGGTIENAIR